MKTFTLNEQNEIVAFATPEEAAATSATPFDCFTSQSELADLAAKWPSERLVAIWNSLPGAKQVNKFRDAKTAINRIWARIEGLGDSDEPQAELTAEKPTAERKAKRGAQAAKGAPTKGKATKKAAPAKTSPKAKKAVKAREAGAPREGSKMAQAIAMMQRKNGATLDDLAATFQWKPWTVRGFVAGALKKAGMLVESYKDEKTGARTYRIGA